jgi:hypothetical protein
LGVLGALVFIGVVLGLPWHGFVDHSVIGTIYSAKTRVVAETDYSTNSRTTVDLNYDSTD